MENQIKSALKVDGNFHSATVFGYSNKGIPGLEIVGLGNEGRIIKEKIIYFIRARSLGLPRKRIVIGVDTNGDFKKRISFEPLELPIFIIFLTLSGHLKTSTLNNCFTIGGISTLGNYIPTFFNKDLHQYIENLNGDLENLCLIAPSSFENTSVGFTIDLDDFLSNIQKIDSPENSLGLSNPSSLSTVGATSLRANLGSIS
jgi:hypothetical protein